MAQVKTEKVVWRGWGVPGAQSSPCHLQEVMSEELARQLHETENDFEKAVQESILSSLSEDIPKESAELQDMEKASKTRNHLENPKSGNGKNGTPTGKSDQKSIKPSEQNVEPSISTKDELIDDDVDGGADDNDGDGDDDDEQTSNDLLIAQMMQQDMILEHNRELRKLQDFKNGNSKVKLSNENMFYYEKEEEEEYEEDEDFTNKSSSKEGDRRGCKGRVTKHDAIVAGRRNVSRMENLPPGFATGNSMAFDMRLSNRVYNGLKVASKQEAKRAHRTHEKKEQATKTVAMDDVAKVSLMKLLGTGVVKAVGGVVSGGKEAAVFYAIGGTSPTILVPPECAVKVFKRYSPFKTKGEYMRGDIRFQKGHSTKLIKEWVEKEEQNLRRMNKFGIPCPQPIVKKNNILVMSFIGQDQVPAPKLSDALLSEQELQNAYSQTVKILIDMYRKCNLVHSDFSQYNLLWFGGVVYVIDVAQAVITSHPKALEYLMRDCINVTEFLQPFSTASWQDLFEQVTGVHIEADKTEFAAQLQKLVKEKQELRGSGLTDEQFEYLFEKAALEKEHDDDDDDQCEESCEDDDFIKCESEIKEDDEFVVVDDGFVLLPTIVGAC